MKAILSIVLLLFMASITLGQGMGRAIGPVPRQPADPTTQSSPALDTTTPPSSSGAVVLPNFTGINPTSDYGYGSGDGTVEGSYFRGLADLARGAGNYNYLSSLGAINLTEAERNALQNDAKAIQEYFERQRMNKLYRVAQRGPRPTTEELARLARQSAPPRLSSRDFDLIEGRINWPDALQTPETMADRGEIQTLFRRHADTGSFGPDGYGELKRAIQNVEQDLIERVQLLPADEYINAKTFLKSLAHEATFPPATVVGQN